jgi:hypothetical protein
LSPPTTTSRIPSPTIDATFTDGWSRSSAVHSCAKVAELPARVILLPVADGARGARRTVLPTTIVVMPCRISDSAHRTLQSEPCRRVNVDEPGATAASRASNFAVPRFEPRITDVMRAPVIHDVELFPRRAEAVEYGAVRTMMSAVARERRSSKRGDDRRRRTWCGEVASRVMPEIVSDLGDVSRRGSELILVRA